MKKIRTLKIRLSILTSASIVLLISCQSAPLDSQNCESQFLDWESVVAQYRAELPEVSSLAHAHRKSRALASVEGSESPPAELQDQDNELWMSRAEKELHRSQKWIDISQGIPNREPATESLQEVANRWVAFHGYAFQRRTPEMSRVLDQIEAELHQAHRLTCPQRDPYLRPNQ